MYARRNYNVAQRLDASHSFESARNPGERNASMTMSRIRIRILGGLAALALAGTGLASAPAASAAGNAAGTAGFPPSASAGRPDQGAQNGSGQDRGQGSTPTGGKTVV